MKKYILDLTLTANEHLRAGYALLKLTHEQPLPEMCPGQFAEFEGGGLGNDLFYGVLFLSIT